MLIDPKFLTLNQLLGERLFRIPNYQRAYSWKRKQREDMFQDIRVLRENEEKRHFMATIVGLKRNTRTIVTDDFAVIDIVDGQQRLTTLALLLKAIEQSLDQNIPVQGKLKRELQELLVKQDEHSLLLLQTNHDTNQYYVNFIRQGVAPAPEEADTLADRSLLRAIHDCREFVVEWDDPVELTAVLKNRLTFIFHQIDNEGAAYTVFEVLNSRGLPVAWLDRLKSYLMAIAFEHDQGNRQEVIEELHSIWTELYRVIGLRQGMSAEALRFAATLRARARRSRVWSEADAVEDLRDQAGEDPANAIDLSHWLLAVARAVDEFLEDATRAQAAVRVAHARLVAVAVLLRDFDAEEQRALLDAWEQVSFRIFGLCRKDARSKVGDYVRLAWEISANEADVGEIREELDRIGSDDEEHGIEWAVEHTRDHNCYEGWEEELRYLLFRYEQHLAGQKGTELTNEQWNRVWATSPAKSIEHVLPQSKGSDRRDEDDVFVHRLGNLTMLPPGLNSQLRDRDPIEKVDEYRETGLLITSDVARRIEDAGGWGVEQVAEREDQILEWIRETW